MKRLLTLAGASAALLACADAPLGHLALNLEDGSPYFRLRIFAKLPSQALTEKALFDTGCIEQRSRTYELTNIPVGEGYAIVFEGFSGSSCVTADRISLGFRGGVSVAESGQPYVHVPVYASAASSAMPADLNLSASAARPIDVCQTDADCGGDLCFDDAAPSYWCVPTCVADTDCTSLHPRATCDASAGWCMLPRPYPFNTSEDRALGAAATLANGDVVLFGGLKQEGSVAVGATASFEPTRFPLERFDATTGLFAPVALTGDDVAPGADFGFAALGRDRFVAVGGIARAQLGWGASGLGFDAAWSTDLAAQILVWELAADGTGRARRSTLGQGQARATVVPLSAESFLVIGGIAASSPGIEVKRGTLRCDLDADLGVTCRGGPTLVTARQSPAAVCVDADGQLSAACQRVLVLGGNSAGPLAEVIDLTANTSAAIATRGLPETLYGPTLCGLDLVAGSLDLLRGAPTTAVRLTPSATELVGNPLAGTPTTSYRASVAPLSTAGQCQVVGGLTASGYSSQIVRVGSSRFDPKGSLQRARFGAQAAQIGRGPLAGAVLVTGGLALPGSPTAPESGRLAPVYGAELYLP